MCLNRTVYITKYRKECNVLTQKTISVSPDTHERLKWYKDTFGFTFDELFNDMMEKLDMASLEKVRQFKQNFRTVKVEGSA